MQVGTASDGTASESADARITRSERYLDAFLVASVHFNDSESLAVSLLGERSQVTHFRSFPHGADYVRFCLFDELPDLFETDASIPASDHEDGICIRRQQLRNFANVTIHASQSTVPLTMSTFKHHTRMYMQSHEDLSTCGPILNQLSECATHAPPDLMTKKVMV